MRPEDQESKGVPNKSQKQGDQSVENSSSHGTEHATVCPIAATLPFKATCTHKRLVLPNFCGAQPLAPTATRPAPAVVPGCCQTVAAQTGIRRRLQHPRR